MFKKACLLITLILIFAHSPSFAASLSVVPVEQNIGLGETAYVDIVLGDLSDDPGITEFFIEVLDFDTSVISFDAADSSFYVAAAAVDFEQQGGPSYVQMYAEGITTSPQPWPDFELVRLAFNATGYGSSEIRLNTALDFFPNNPGLNIDEFNNGTINVVPIPGAVWLLGSGLLGLLGAKRRLGM